MYPIYTSVLEASKNSTIIAGFNIFGFEDAQAVIKAAERMNHPAMLMINRDSSRVMNIKHWGALLASLAASANVPIGVHLDHCSDVETVEAAIDYGFHSVMYDGSSLPFEENVKNTQRVCEKAHKKGVTVEAELGKVPYAELGDMKTEFTSVEEARMFCEQTEVDWLAISVGNIHRLIGSRSNINFETLKQIELATTVPLVIHGASGIEPADVQKMKSTRVGKINVGTALRRVFGQSLREQIEGDPNIYDRLDLFKEPIIKVEDEVCKIMTEYCK